MGAFRYDALTGAIAALVAVGVFLISLSVLDIFDRLIVGLVAAISPSFARATRVRSALADNQELQRR